MECGRVSGLRQGLQSLPVHLARIIHESLLASWTIHPSGFDYCLLRPPLKAGLERVLIHESLRFVNNAG